MLRHAPGPCRARVRNSPELWAVSSSSHRFRSRPRSAAEVRRKTHEVINRKLAFTWLHLGVEVRGQRSQLLATSALRPFHTSRNTATLPSSVFFWYPEEELESEKVQLSSRAS